MSTLDLHVDPLQHSHLDLTRDFGTGLLVAEEFPSGSVAHRSPQEPRAFVEADDASARSSSACSSSAGVDVDIVFTQVSLGIQFGRSGSRFVVEEATGAARERGVSPGDAIVVVNGRKLPSDMDNDELADLLSELPRPLLLGFRRVPPAPSPSDSANPQSSSSRGRAALPDSGETSTLAHEAEYGRRRAAFVSSDDLSLPF